MIEILEKLYQRDLEKLKIEITSYKDEKKMWKVAGELKNSAGNLCLHICGNLQHFIGALLGNTGYVRKRELEFSKTNVPVTEMVAEIDKTQQIVQKTLSALKKLNDTYPVNVLGYEMTTGFFLTHLTTHLSYHLGQINYHRRILDN